MKASKKTKSLNIPAGVKRDECNLPSHDALAQILPDYQSLFNRAKTELQRKAQHDQHTPAKRADSTEGNRPNVNGTYQVRHPHKRPPLHDFEYDPHVTEIFDLRTKEIENYRSAMGRMAEDIITLRTQVLSLETENSQLCSDLSLQHELGQGLLSDTDIDVMTKAEIADHLVTLKFKLASVTSKAASQRDQIQQLQNKLIQKNDSEKEPLKLQSLLQQQKKELQEHQSCLAKMATLEATVKQQEKVIEKMEKALDSRKMENCQCGDKRLLMKRQRDYHEKEETELALAAENTCLRKEFERIHQPPPPLTVQQPAQTKEALTFKEKLSLLNKQVTAETRIQTLEAQLEENAKVWGRQKQEMLTKLSEHRHGFVRTSTAVLHNFPSVS